MKAQGICKYIVHSIFWILSIFLWWPLQLSAFTAPFTLATIVDTPVQIRNPLGMPDSVAKLTDSLNASQTDIKSPISYSAVDSIVYDVEAKKIYLYNRSAAEYQTFQLNAYAISFDQETFTLLAEGKDSLGSLVQKPQLKDNDQTYDAQKFAYNLKTQKGKVYEAITEQNGAYIHMFEAKRNENNQWYGKRAWFTSCNEEHPHFYIQSNKTQFIPDKIVVSGPANLVVADVPLPVFIPFGIYPLKKGAHSGLILPQISVKNTGSIPLGYGLENGGYYFAINPKLALTLTAKAYTRGSWGITVKPDYRQRYRYGGSLQFEYFRRRPANPENPEEKASNDFKIDWQHSQDAKARPGVSFSASVHAQTSSYNSNTYNTSESVLNTVLSSNINYGKNFRGTPFSLSVSASHSQNLVTRIVNIRLPTFNFSISRIYPFKKKLSAGKASWYEKIAFSYNLEASNTINTVDSLLFKKQSLQNLQYGVRHIPKLDFSTTLFKYIKLVPSIGFTERWYFKTQEKSWNSDTFYISTGDTITDTIFGKIETDTVNGFFSNRDFSLGLSLSTKLYGIWKFKNKHILGMKHDFSPSLAFTYRPDFGTAFWDYYRFVQSSQSGDSLKYSRFDQVGSLYGQAPQGKLGSLSLSLNNRLEIKVRSKSDTITNEKKLSLLDNFGLRMSYNFAVDTLRLSNLDISGSSTPFPNFSVRFGMSFDPYVHDSTDRRINQFLIKEEKKILRITSATISFSGRISAKKSFRNRVEGQEDEEEISPILQNPDAYYDFNSPWNLSMGYNLGLRRQRLNDKDTTQLSVHAFNADMDFNLTNTWKVSLQSGFNFMNKKITYTNIAVVRDLHCWELRIGWVPGISGSGSSYTISLQAKPGILQSLKLNKKAYPGQFDF